MNKPGRGVPEGDDNVSIGHSRQKTCTRFTLVQIEEAMGLSLQRFENQRAKGFDAGPQRGRCFTEYSIAVLVAGALVLSALLWLAIYAVI